jgi:holo-[acyl-carrier protein] synthase
MKGVESILGHGVDIVEIDRIARALADHPQRFPERIFTFTERAYCDLAPRRRAERYAARFAVKEAVLKALGTGWTEGIAWTDLEVLRLASGEPRLLVTGRAAEVAASRGIGRWLVSMSHSGTHAIGSAIALSA